MPPAPVFRNSVAVHIYQVWDRFQPGKLRPLGIGGVGNTRPPLPTPLPRILILPDSGPLENPDICIPVTTWILYWIFIYSNTVWYQYKKAVGWLAINRLVGLQSHVWGQSTQIPSSLSPKRDCSPKRVELFTINTPFRAAVPSRERTIAHDHSK